MKTIFTLLAAIMLYSGTASSQVPFSYQRIGGDTTYVPTSNNAGYAYAVYRNTSNSTIRVRFERTMNVLPNSEWTSSVCAGICYAPDQNFAPPLEDPAITLLPGQQDTMDATMYCPTDGVASMKIRIYNADNASEFIENNFIVVRGTTGISITSTTIPNGFNLKQNFPNPFNPSTKINFDISKAADVSLSVYDLAGKKITDLVNNVTFQPGSYQVDFDAAAFSLPSGVYLYKISVGSFTQTRKMTLVK